MKGMLFSFAGVFILMIMLKESSCPQKDSVKTRVMPLSTGNTWIYRDSIYTDGRLASVSNDTIRILRSSLFEGATTYIFSDGRELMTGGDTLFQMVSQRSGVKFPTPVFIPTETETKFNYAYGGDVMIQRTVTKMRNCPVNTWSLSDCYRVSDGCRGEAVFGYGMGVIKEKISDCSPGNQNYTVKTLMKVNFRN